MAAREICKELHGLLLAVGVVKQTPSTCHDTDEKEMKEEPLRGELATGGEYIPAGRCPDDAPRSGNRNIAQ